MIPQPEVRTDALVKVAESQRGGTTRMGPPPPITRLPMRSRRFRSTILGPS